MWPVCGPCVARGLAAVVYCRGGHTNDVARVWPAHGPRAARRKMIVSNGPTKLVSRAANCPRAANWPMALFFINIS